jgi:hypothetical protein
MSYGADSVNLSLPYKSNPETRNRVMFPDPFLDMASLVMPESMMHVLNMCEGIWLKNGTYRMAASRIVRYFITKVETEGLGEQQRADFNNFLNSSFNITETLTLLGDDFLAYGNSLSSIILPFRRFLVCKACGHQRPIDKLEWTFKNYEFEARCVVCRAKTPHAHVDRRSTEEDKICTKRWSPREIRILHHPIAQMNEYYWQIPADLAGEIRQGTPFYVQHMPWEIIESVKMNQLFKFNPDVMYHMKEQSLAGVNARGWGISRLLSNFAQAWYTQVLKRYNEALALDYVVPFRVLTPAPHAKEGDPMLNMNMGNFTANVMRMLQKHRKDPADWHTLPFPLNYQALGGEAKNLMTHEMLDQGMDELLNAIGIPAEMYRGTLQLQAMPMALRLFQQTWPQLTAAYNGWLEWASTIICTALNWDQPDQVRLQPVTLADDMEQRAMWMQLASSNLISRRTAFAPWGIDATEEQKRVFEEQKNFQDMNDEFAQDMEQRQMNRDVIMQAQMPQQPGQPPMPGVAPGNAPMMGAPTSGGGGSTTPMDMMAQADSMAQQLLQMPYEARRREMSNIQDSDQALHAMVKQKMEDYRSQAASVGQQAVLSGQM